MDFNKDTPHTADDFDNYEEMVVYFPPDTLRRIEAIAEERGTNAGDLIADTMALTCVPGRGAF